MNRSRIEVYWSIFGSHLLTDSRPLMVGKIVEHSQPVRGVKISSRIERKWLRTVVELKIALLMAINKRSIKWKSIYLFYTFCFNQFIKFVSVGYSLSVRADISKYRSFLNPLQRCLEATSLILIRNYLRTITCAITYTRNCLILDTENRCAIRRVSVAVRPSVRNAPLG